MSRTHFILCQFCLNVHLQIGKDSAVVIHKIAESEIIQHKQRCLVWHSEQRQHGHILALSWQPHFWVQRVERPFTLDLPLSLKQALTFLRNGQSHQWDHRSSAHSSWPAKGATQKTHKQVGTKLVWVRLKVTVFIILSLCPLQGPIWAKTRLPRFSYKAQIMGWKPHIHTVIKLRW